METQIIYRLDLGWKFSNQPRVRFGVGWILMVDLTWVNPLTHPSCSPNGNKIDWRF